VHVLENYSKDIGVCGCVDTVQTGTIVPYFGPIS
jgi:hypothetical protein